MDKVISTKLQEDDAQTLEKIAAERGESVSGFLRNLVRMAIEKNGKVDGSGEEKQPVPDPKIEEILTLLWRMVEAKPVQNPVQNSDPETAKKIDDLTKLLSGVPAILNDNLPKIMDEIGKIPKPTEGGGGDEIAPETAKKILDSLTENTGKLTEVKRLMTEKGETIGPTVSSGWGQVSFKNPKFWRKSLAVLVLWSLIFSAGNGWGMWKIYERGTLNAETTGMALADPAYESINHVIYCDVAGWKWKWDENKKNVLCVLGPNPKTGQPYELRIR